MSRRARRPKINKNLKKISYLKARLCEAEKDIFVIYKGLKEEHRQTSNRLTVLMQREKKNYWKKLQNCCKRDVRKTFNIANRLRRKRKKRRIDEIISKYTPRKKLQVLTNDFDHFFANI